jgi:hypothetical protein
MRMLTLHVTCVTHRPPPHHLLWETVCGRPTGELGGRALWLCLVAKCCLELTERMRGTMREATRLQHEEKNGSVTCAGWLGGWGLWEILIWCAVRHCRTQHGKHTSDPPFP